MVKNYLNKQRVISFFLVFVVVFSLILNIFTPVVYATNANERQASFLNYYKDSSGLTLNVESMTVQDYYTLYVFMSNFFEPGVTRLSELENCDESSNFFDSFSKILGKQGDTNLQTVVKRIASDTKMGLESGICTLSNASGEALSGLEFLEKLAYSVDLKTGTLKDKSNLKIYYNRGKDVTIDFASPAYRAAFQVLATYNSEMFMNEKGIQSLDILFVDAVGNIWGLEAGSYTSALQNTTNLNGLISTVGSEHVYIILPACLNPATFSADITDSKSLKMPLMNRYTLGCLLDITDFNDANGDAIFSKEAIAFYNLFYSGYLGSFSRANKGLSIYGVQSISPYLMNTGYLDYDDAKKCDSENCKGDSRSNSTLRCTGIGENGFTCFCCCHNDDSTGIYAYGRLNTWTSALRRQDLANFIYDAEMISVNKSVKNGIGQFGTNTYIVFSPNMVDSNSNQDKTNPDTGNRAVDMQTEFLFWTTSTAYTTFINYYGDDKELGYELQQQMLAYLYSPTVLNLNQVSMSFYFQDSGISTTSNASEDYAKYLYDYEDPEEILASQMGMRGFSLFFSDISDKQDLEDGKYVGIKADVMKHSKLTTKLMTELSNDWHQIKTYERVSKGRNISDVISNLQTSSNAVENIINFIYHYSGEFDPDDYGANDTYSHFVEGTDDYEDFYVYYIYPRGFVNAGSGSTGDGVKDVSFSRTAGFGDITLLNSVASLDYDLKDSGKESDSNATVRINQQGGYSDSNLYFSDTNIQNHLLALTFFQYSLFSPSEAVLKACTIESTLHSGSLFGQTDIQFTSNIYLSDFTNQNFVMGIYFGYIIDMMGIESCSESGLKINGFSSVFLPQYSNSAGGGEMGFENIAGNSGIINSEDLSFEEKQKDLINRIYGLTSEGGNEYRNGLIKNILDGLFLTVHRTITGTWGSNVASVAAGTTNTYQAVTGYIYTPTLEELPFTATLMNNYIQIYIFCMVLVIFILILMVLLNMRSLSQGLITLVVMAVALLFPYILISNTINISNKIADSIYSDRFDFWAMMEHQQSVLSLANVATMNDKDALLTISTATSDSTYAGNTGVKIKWMSPKKVDMFQNLYSDKSLSESFVTNIEIFKWLFNSFIYDSEFVDTDVYGSFLYRPYNTIALEAEAYYAWGEELINKGAYNSISDYDLGGYVFSNIPVSISDTLELLKPLNNSDLMFIYGLSKIDKSYYNLSSLKLSLTSRLNDINTVRGLSIISSSNTSSLVGTWGMLSSEVTEIINNANNITDLSTIGTTNVDSGQGIASNLPSVTANDYFKNYDYQSISKAIYLKNTESPYYYFYSVLKSRYSDSANSAGPDNPNAFKKALLNGSLYKVSSNEESLLDNAKDVKGSIRDFLDLEGLFTYVIPYLKLSNDYVIAWQGVNGSEIEEYNFDYEVNETTGNVGAVNSDGISTDYEKQAKRKNALNKVWNMYSPWVDSLYAIDGVLNEKVSVGGTKIYIEDTLNPSSYIESGRPMIFSEADMIVKGYNYAGLTDVERRIQSVLEKTYTDLMYLVNYYDLEEDVLIAAAAMYATFNFNAEFSDTSFMGESVMLYPQTFELKNFNYDAFMRLALLNATGENVFDTNDLYERILAKTSLFTGLFLILCDLFACVIIPIFKFVIIIALLFLGLLMCITCMINPPEKIFAAISKSVLLPTCLFMVLNIVFAWVLSLIIGEGLTAYVGSKGINLATNDPNMTMLIMAFIGGIYVFVAWKIIKMIFDSYKKYGMSTVLAGIGILTSAFSSAVGTVTRKTAGAAIGAATAGKGNRLAGAFEGASTGITATLNQRAREKRYKDMMKYSGGRGGGEGVTEDINAKAGGIKTEEQKNFERMKQKLNEKPKPFGGLKVTSTAQEEMDKHNTTYPKSDVPKNKNRAVPPSELDRKFTADYNKKDNKLGRAISSVVYAKERARDALDGLNYKKDMVKMSLREKREKMDDAWRRGKKAIKDAPKNIKEGASRKVKAAKNYLNEGLKQGREHNEYMKYKREVRNDERMGRIIDRGTALNKAKREKAVFLEAEKRNAADRKAAKAKARSALKDIKTTRK